MDMKAESLLVQPPPGQAFSIQDSPFSLRGACPHCSCATVFLCVAKPHSETVMGEYGNQITGWKSWAAMQCQGCKKYILGAVVRDTNNQRCEYLEHYPLDKPEDKVASEIPERIGADFKEALSCRWVKAFNATAEMCRRAIQTSCLELGAPASDSITAQIDWVHSQSKITAALKEVAHKIRLGGNRAAHPNYDEGPISPEEADAIIVFTQHYLDHVYVVPKKLDTFDFSKGGRKAAASQNVP
jgi:hypothetical protein